MFENVLIRFSETSLTLKSKATEDVNNITPTCFPAASN